MNENIIFSFVRVEIHFFFSIYFQFVLLLSGVFIVDGTFPLFWQPPRPNHITYNFVNGQHRRGYSQYPNRYGIRPSQHTVLRLNSPSFGVRLTVPPSRINPNNLNHRSPVGLNDFVYSGQYDASYDALYANYLRSSLPHTAPREELTTFPYRNPYINPDHSARPAPFDFPQNFPVPPNSAPAPQPLPFRPQQPFGEYPRFLFPSNPGPPPRPYPPFYDSPNFQSPSHHAPGPQPLPPRPYPPFDSSPNFLTPSNTAPGPQPLPPRLHPPFDGSPNFLIPPNGASGPQSPRPHSAFNGSPNFSFPQNVSPSRPFQTPEIPAEFLAPPNILRSVSPLPQFNVPYPFRYPQR